MKLRPKFFLSTLLLLTLTLASGVVLLLHWAPWYLARTCNMATIDSGEDTILLASSPDGAYCISMENKSHILHAWDTQNGKEIARLDAKYSFDIFPSVIPRNDQTVFLKYSADHLKIWSLNTGILTERMKEFNGRVISVHSGRYVLALPSPGLHVAWDLDLDKEIFRKNFNVNEQWFWSPDGTRVIIQNSGLEFWDATRGVCMRTSDVNPGIVLGRFSKDGKYFFSLGKENLRIWDSIRCEHLTYHYCNSMSNDVLVLSNDNTLIGASISGFQIDYWNLKDGSLAYRMEIPTSEIFTNVIDLPSGAKFVSASYAGKYSNRVLRVWDKSTGEHLGIIDALSIKAISIFPLGDELGLRTQNDVRIYRNRRPEQWWGVFYLPEFWLTVIFTPALLINFYRNVKRAKTTSA